MEETSDTFLVRVELATVNVVGRYAHREHETCMLACPMGLSWHLALRPVAKKRKSDAGARPMGNT
jgi:hypothetical protein